jgi:aminoglycoside phosphotransferase (APT) family kinase protein
MYRRERHRYLVLCDGHDRGPHLLGYELSSDPVGGAPCLFRCDERDNRTASHAPAAIGLEDFGRPGNYFARQIARWSRQYLEDDAAGRDPHMDRLIDWLPANIPVGDETCLVHGDFRVDNMIFHPSEPRVIAVLDWELSTLGHPLADFANHAMMYQMPPNIVAGLLGADLQRLNIPDQATYTDAYCRRSGRSAIPHFDFYVAFNFFRLAAIYHGIKGRVIRGTAASPNALERATQFPVLAEIAWAQCQRAEGRAMQRFSAELKRK